MANLDHVGAGVQCNLVLLDLGFGSDTSVKNALGVSLNSFFELHHQDTKEVSSSSSCVQILDAINICYLNLPEVTTLRVCWSSRGQGPGQR